MMSVSALAVPLGAAFGGTQARMRAMTGIIGILAQNARGATALEYALIAAMVATVILGGVTTLGTTLNDLFGALGDLVASRSAALQ
jgi:pilus assembly protein Flp/PilA